MAQEESDDLVIEAAPFEQIPREAFFGDPKDGVTLTPRGVTCYLILRALGAERNFRITRKKIAKAMGVSSLRTVDNTLDELVEKGWLLITPTFRESGDRQQSANRFTLLWNHLDAEDDPRLVRHRAAIEVFESDMTERQKANLMRDQEEAEKRGITVAELRSGRKGRVVSPLQKTARGETTPSQNSAGGTPVQNSATRPVQKIATQNPDLLLIQTQNPSSPSSEAPEDPTGSPDGSPKKETKAKRGTRINPDDFEAPTPAMVQFWQANCPDVNAKVETANFVDYWTSKAGKDGVKLDWVATWRTWMRRAQQRINEQKDRQQARQGTPFRSQDVWGPVPDMGQQNVLSGMEEVAAPAQDWWADDKAAGGGGR